MATEQSGKCITKLKPLVAMIVVPIRSIIRMSRQLLRVRRLANSGHICKKHTLIDYGSGKGRIEYFHGLPNRLSFYRH